jgi:hypothetical protein
MHICRGRQHVPGKQEKLAYLDQEQAGSTWPPSSRPIDRTLDNSMWDRLAGHQWAEAETETSVARSLARSQPAHDQINRPTPSTTN